MLTSNKYTSINLFNYTDVGLPFDNYIYVIEDKKIYHRSKHLYVNRYNTLNFRKVRIELTRQIHSLNRKEKYTFPKETKTYVSDTVIRLFYS